MGRPISTETTHADFRDDLLSRGYSRRQLGRILAVFGSGAIAAGIAGPPASAAEAPSLSNAPSLNSGARIRIGKNECWTGPMAPGRTAAAAILGLSNRYSPHHEREDFIATVEKVEGVPGALVTPWPGSSDPLCRSIVTFCSPTRGLVTADPTFELAGQTAEWLGAPLKRVPLTPDYRHDVKAMLAADPNAGLYYICTPNNPTGTITPIEDIEWLLANKPAGSLVVVDEAYIHFASVPTVARLVVAGKDVIILRTFSKLFGMAGMRVGYMMTRPDIQARMTRYDGMTQSIGLPMPSLVCATASLSCADLIAGRRTQMRQARAMAIAHVRKRGLNVLPTDANMFIVDWRTKPAQEMESAFMAQGVEIGRAWPIWPTRNRITVGSMADMTAFCAALDKVWT